MYTDASWCPMTHATGWAAWLRSEVGRLVVSGYCVTQTSYEAELAAIGFGIKTVRARWGGTTGILVKTDCLSAVRFLEQHEVRKPGKQVNRRAAKYKERILEIADGVRLRLEWTPGHAGGAEAPAYINRRVDHLAREQMRRARRLIRTEERKVL